MKSPVWVMCEVNKIVLYSGTKKECINFITKYQPQLSDYVLKLW